MTSPGCWPAWARASASSWRGGHDDAGGGAAEGARRRARGDVRLRRAGCPGLRVPAAGAVPAARQTYAIHRAARDELTVLVSAKGADPVAAEVSYDPPGRFGTAVQIRTTARTVEQRLTKVYAELVANTSGEDRRWAIGALDTSSLRELDFGGVPDRLPGSRLTELRRRACVQDCTHARVGGPQRCRRRAPGRGAGSTLDLHRPRAGPADGARAALLAGGLDAGRRARPRRGAASHASTTPTSCCGSAVTRTPTSSAAGSATTSAMRRGSYDLDWRGLPYLTYLLQHTGSGPTGCPAGADADRADARRPAPGCRR